MSNRPKKGAKSKAKPAAAGDLQQYYADDMIEEESSGTEVRRPQARNVAVIEEEDEGEEVQYEIGGEQNKEKLKKENMDKISDILVSMMFKNVKILNFLFALNLPARKSIQKMLSISLFLTSKNSLISTV